MSRRAAILLIGPVLAVAGACAFYLQQQQALARVGSELRSAQDDLRASRFHTARKRLEPLVRAHPTRGDLAFHLGVAYRSLGDAERAMTAWAQVPENAREFGWAWEHIALTEQERGRFGPAEKAFHKSLGRPGDHNGEARWGLVKLLRLECRFDEARELYLEGEPDAPDSVVFWKRMYTLDTEEPPLGEMRRSLEEAHRLAPDDPRVWLGLARLELLFGDETTARQWLDRCRRQDPGPESAVDLAELDWSLAAGDASIARRSLEQLLPGSIGLRAQAAAAAWFAARRGDRSSEFDRLKDLVELDPAAPRAWDRLAELASLDGDADGAAEFRARKAAIEPIRERYLVAMRAPDIRAHAARLADLARSLGRMRDALGWAKLATNDSSVAAANLKESESPLADRIRRNLLAELEHTVDRQADGLSSAVVFPRFEDRAASAGVTFLHRNGGAAGRLIPPVTASGGVALFDYDRDGWLDLYIVQGGDFPPRPDASPTAGDRLYRNRRDGTFEDVTEAAGLGGYRGYGHGVTVGDINNDGWPDLFVTRWRAYALYLNRSDGTFEEITERAGFAGDRDWPTSAAFADIDQDGDLDLYVCHYLSWNEGEERVCSDPKDPAVYRCAPRDFPALPDHLFRNDNGQFVDISESARITSADSNGRGLGVAAGDFDDDGRIDFYVANDTTANYLFRNLGDGQFEEIAHAAGAAANATGGYQAGMGIARGDLDGDGRLDLAVTNFFNESTTFFHSLDVPGTAAFADHTSAINLLAPSRGLLGFGIVFLDANNDGKLDVLTANGHVHDGRPLFPWTMPTQLLLTGTDGRLIDAGRRAGDCFATPHLGRGLAAGDLDNDGRIDAVLVSQNEAPVVYGNRTDSPGHFLTLGLEGAKGSNRDAIGARVTVVTSLASQVAERTGGGSYQSASEPRMHFGLGAAERIESITVRWPSGRSERYDGALPDHGYLLKEESRELRPLPGWAHVPTDPESRLSPSPSRTSP